jgi:hypothetical protein
MNGPDKKIFIENLGDMPACAGEFTGVYAGSGFCQEALPSPEELLKLAAAARERNLSFHLITPYLTESHFHRAAELADALAREAPGSEVIANDLGFLSAVASDYPALVPVAGPILAFQRTDPQIPAILEGAFDGAELEKKRDSLRHISVNNPIFARFLMDRRVSRIEMQNPVQGLRLSAPGFGFTLHIPYVYVTSTRFCQPVERLTKPGRVPGVYGCLRQCSDRYFRLKPRGADVQFIFRGNTIYYENPSASIPPDIDRLVVHKLPS